MSTAGIIIGKTGSGGSTEPTKVATRADLYVLTGLVGGERYSITDEEDRIMQFKGGGESSPSHWRSETTSDDLGSIAPMSFVSLTQAAYDAIPAPGVNTIYNITDA